MRAFLLGTLLLPLGLMAQTIDVDLGHPGADIAPTMWGIFFEDINFGADGGLYAELVNNRSFEYPGNPLQGWKTIGRIEVRDDGPFGRNPHYVRLCHPGHPAKRTGLENGGYFGIGLKEGEQYRFCVWARVPEGGQGKLCVELPGKKAWLEVDSPQWKQYDVELTADETVARCFLRVWLESQDVPVDIEHVSLFPMDTWKGRRNGLRKDLVQALYDLHPGVFRFPGGCIVEGADLATRYSWKNSVGPVEDRPLNENRWQYCFEDRVFPDYHQSYGMGFYELFCLSEDLGAEPLPILSCGLACQFMNNDLQAHAPLDSLETFIRDAIDLVEFANGGVDTPWGAVRAQMGHPEPFHLKYIGIGNEQWGSEYIERLEPFLKAFRAACPQIQVVGSAGPYPSGNDFDYLWGEMRRLKADLVDEHYYQSEEWFLQNASRYDSYPRKGPKVFAGEYACHSEGRKYNNYNAALCEAAFMTGLERNADVVRMATYAPLFAHVEGWQWRPDLIWFDNLNVYKTGSYQVQALYGEFRGRRVLPVRLEGEGLYASAVQDGDRFYVKVVNVADEPRTVSLRLGGIGKGRSVNPLRKVSLRSDDAPARSELSLPSLTAKDNAFRLEVPPRSFEIYVFSSPAK